MLVKQKLRTDHGITFAIKTPVVQHVLKCTGNHVQLVVKGLMKDLVRLKGSEWL